MSEPLDRSLLDGKDREELHAIAGAMGVKAPTRMRKADLIEAILGAANGDNGEGDNGSEGGSAARRTVRSARASELAAATVDAIADEENALPNGDTEPVFAPRPRR